MFGLDPEQLQKLQSNRFLIVDDEVVNTQFFVHFFEDMELEVDVAHDGRQAVERVLSQPPGYYHAVLMDIRMPQMSGTDATLEIRRHSQWSELPIIAMSGNCQVQDRQHYLDCGMVDLLPKPAELNAIVQMLLKWTAQGNSAELKTTSSQNAIAIEERGTDGANSSAQSPLSGLSFDQQLQQRQQQLAMELCGFKRLLQAFRVSQQQARQLITQACQNRDPQQLEAGAHKLAGACGNIGLMDLRLSLKSLEQRSQTAANWVVLQADWVKIEQQLVALDPLLGRYIDG